MAINGMANATLNPSGAIFAPVPPQTVKTRSQQMSLGEGTPVCPPLSAAALSHTRLLDSYPMYSQVKTASISGTSLLGAGIAFASLYAMRHSKVPVIAYFGALAGAVLCVVGLKSD